jgi:hypothetical protein
MDLSERWQASLRFSDRARAARAIVLLAEPQHLLAGSDRQEFNDRS